MTSVTSIQAWKEVEIENLISTLRRRARMQCEMDDPLAVEFCVSYPGAPYMGATLDFADKFVAENVARAMERVYLEGKAKAKEELRNWLSDSR